MLTLTFIRATNGTRLSKKIIKEEGKQLQIEPYPRVALMSSRVEEITDEVEWPAQLITSLNAADNNGETLLKGSLLVELNNERRKDKTNRDGANKLFVVDIDGLPIPGYERANIPYSINEAYLKQMARDAVDLLPPFMHGKSYVAHASSSTGIKEGIRLHLFFLFNRAVKPKMQQELLTLLNFYHPTAEDHIKLLNTGNSIGFSIDRTLSENSRLIYVAKPTFVGIHDPVRSRLVEYVGEDNYTLNAQEARAWMREQALTAQQAVAEKKRSLRLLSGLPERCGQTIQIQTAYHARQSVTLNPRPMSLHEVDHDDIYIRYNVGEGDSNAYWVYKEDPRVVHNFKGEDSFLFEQADPEGFAACCEIYGYTPPVEAAEDLAPFVFLHAQKNSMVCAKITVPMNHELPELKSEMYTLSPTNARLFMASNGGVIPDAEDMPCINPVFDPHDSRSVDVNNSYINLFIQPPMLKTPVRIPRVSVGCSLEDGPTTLENLCPSIYKVMYSMAGCGDINGNGNDDMVTLGRFINWLAFIIQQKEKTQTAWVFHGVQGTGKGALFSNVIQPILTKQYAVAKNQEDLEDKFNEWLETALLVVVDEFRLSNSTDKKLFNKLKQWVTEDTLSLRRMHAGSVARTSYANFMFFSNDLDVLKVSSNDRRINVAPQQTMPLFTRFHELRDSLIERLEVERPQFAAFLLAHQCDTGVVREAISNQAKEDMREATQTPTERVVQCIKSGCLEAFLDVLECNDKERDFNEPMWAKARWYVSEYINLIHPFTKVSPHLLITPHAMRCLYLAQTGTKVITNAELVKLMLRKGLLLPKSSGAGKRFRINSNQPYTRENSAAQTVAYRVQFHLKGLSTDAIRELQGSVSCYLIQSKL